MEIVRQLAGRVMPASCLLCGSDPGTGNLFCRDCFGDLPAQGNACPVCARPQTSGLTCGHCLRHPPPFHQALAAFHYDFPVDGLIRAFKYHGRLELARGLTPALGQRIRRSHAHYGVEAILPVPLYRLRLCRRGFNQAREIARCLGGELGLPVDCRLVRRRRATREQSRLRPAERRRNVRRAFVLNGECHYERIAIVDDVITTGATVSELARLLRRHGVRDIRVWALAKASDKS